MNTSTRDEVKPQRSDVFISYSRKDREFVKRLEAELQNRGREAWVDWEGIRPAEEFMQAIFPAIEGTDTFIFVLSPDSVTSEICGKELAHAVSHNKRMIPIMARDTDAKAVPESLAKLNWVFARDADSFEAAADFLISALDTDLGWIRAHTRLLTRAIEWEGKAKSNSFVLRGEDLRAAEQWLAQAGTEKERQPTALQTEYIIASRKAAARRQRITLGAVSFGLVVAVVLAVVAFLARQRAVEQEEKARNTSVQADFDVAQLDQANSDVVSPRSLAHLARALRTESEARLPREYLCSLLRDTSWYLPTTDALSHDRNIVSVAFSADGRRLLTATSGGAGGTARVWNVESGHLVGEPRQGGHVLGDSRENSAEIAEAAFSKEGRRIVTAAPSQKFAQILDVETGSVVGAQLLHEGMIRAASFSPNGRRVVTASDDGTARVWDVESGASLGEPLRHKEMLQAVTFSPDGRLIVTVSEDHTTQVWDAETHQAIGKAQSRGGFPDRAVFSPDSRRVVLVSYNSTMGWEVGSQNPAPVASQYGDQTLEAISKNTERVATSRWNEAWIWETGGKQLSKPLGHDDFLTGVDFTPDGRQVITTAYDRTARMWEGESGRSLGEPLRHEDRVSGARFSADGRRLVTVAWTKAQVWETESTGSARLPFSEWGVVSPSDSCAGGGRLLTVSSDKKLVRVWDITSGRMVGTPLSHESEIVVAIMSPDGRLVVTGGGGQLQRWNAETGKSIGEPLPSHGQLTAAYFSPDAQRVLAVSANTAQLWNAQNGVPIGKMLQTIAPIGSASLSTDGRRILTIGAFDDSAARVWDAESADLIGQPMNHLTQPRVGKISADGRRIVIAVAEGEDAYLWDVETSRELGRLHHDNRVQDVNFSPDGGRIVTASDDKAARVWDAETGKPVGDMMPHRAGVMAAGFSTDGKRIATVSDTVARIWDASSGKPVSVMLQHNGRLRVASFGAGDQRIVTISEAGIAQVWDVAIDFHTMLPSWVPELAEAVGGRRLDEKGLLAPPPKSLVALRKELMAADSLALKGEDFWSRFGLWFFTRGPARTISPDSRVTVDELDRLRAMAEMQRTAAPP